MHVRLCLPVILACLTLSAPPAWASKVAWQTDLQQALFEAERSNKPLLVEFTASWCGYCRKMKQTTFADERIAKHVAGCFVPVSIDADENQRLMQKVGVDALPTTLILSRDLRVVRRISGYQTPQQFEEHLASVCPHAAETEFTAVSDSGPAAGNEPQAASVAPAAVPAFAFDRLCLVSLRDEHRLRTGLPTCIAEYRGRRVCFASPEHQRQFEQHPDDYWPVLDGRCAVSGLDHNLDRPGDPRVSLVYRGRIWLFADREREQRFFKDAAAYAKRVPQPTEQRVEVRPGS